MVYGSASACDGYRVTQKSQATISESRASFVIEKIDASLQRLSVCNYVMIVQFRVQTDSLIRLSLNVVSKNVRI